MYFDYQQILSPFFVSDQHRKFCVLESVSGVFSCVLMSAECA